MKKINVDLIKNSIQNNKILNKLIYFDSIDSTNKFLADNNFASGTIVLAAEQTAGRGKHGAVWTSARGGLWLSFVINKKVKTPYDYVVLSSVAVVEALGKYGLKAEIKWPNDIIADGKKLSGILLENDFYTGRLITGLGMNVNNRPPAGINAVSVKQLLRRQPDISRLASDIITEIDRYICGLKEKRRSLFRKWTDMQKNLEGSEIKLQRSEKTIKVKVVKVTNGRIKVRDNKGKVFTVSGEVFFK